MGWRDRDYARWTDEERRRFYNSNSGFATADDWPNRIQARHGGLLRPGAALAIVASLFFAVGQLPLHHPLVPALHVNLPGSASTSRAVGAPLLTGTINGPSTANVGTKLALQGTAPQGNRTVTVEGSYDEGRTWQTFSTVASANGSYAATIVLNQRGLLQLKVLFSNGSSEVGSITVQ